MQDAPPLIFPEPNECSMGSMARVCAFYILAMYPSAAVNTWTEIFRWLRENIWYEAKPDDYTLLNESMMGLKRLAELSAEGRHACPCGKPVTVSGRWVDTKCFGCRTRGR